MATFFVFVDFLKNQFSQLFSGIQDPVVERFLNLLFLGDHGIYSKLLTDIFLELGLLHVLVLSGTQVNILKKIHVFCFSITTYKISKSRQGYWPLGFYFRLSWILLNVLYGFLTKWTPPISRALLISGPLELFRPLSLGWKIFFGLTMHVLIFPHHVYEKSFYLSWICWISKILVSKFKWPEIFENMLLSGVFWVGIGFWVGVPMGILLKKLPLVLLTAVCIGPWIERLLFPLGLFLVYLGIQFGFLGWIFGGLGLLGACLEKVGLFILPILEGLASSLLVGLWAFRYIWGTL